MTNSFTSDKIAELAMGLKKLIPKNKLKKFLTNEKLCGKISELIRVGAAKILDN